MSSVLFLFGSNEKWKMLTNFRRNSHMGNITEVCSVGVMLLCVWGWTDLLRLISLFSQLICENVSDSIM